MRHCPFTTLGYTRFNAMHFKVRVGLHTEIDLWSLRYRLNHAHTPPQKNIRGIKYDERFGDQMILPNITCNRLILIAPLNLIVGCNVSRLRNQPTTTKNKWRVMQE